MTAVECATLRRLVAWSLQRAGYRHCDPEEWEDLLQEGVIRAWQELQKPIPMKFSTVVVKACHWGAAEYLRSYRCRRPGGRQRRPAPMFFAEIMPEDAAGDWAPGETVEIEIEAILDRVEGDRFWAMARETLHPDDYEILWQVIGLGRLRSEVAAERGVHASRVSQRVRQSLVRLRLKLGVPPPARGPQDAADTLSPCPG